MHGSLIFIRGLFSAQNPFYKAAVNFANFAARSRAQGMDSLPMTAGTLGEIPAARSTQAQCYNYD